MEANGENRSKRYDRQIRIWGSEGQQRLESSKILLLKCSPTGAETLKNLVLGGIGAFTIVDGEKISARDLGNNFLVNAESLGHPRCKIVTELLKELNETVHGSYVEEEPEVLLESNPNFFSGFDLVIATQMREKELCRLDQICRQAGSQLLIVRSYGLVGYMRASMTEHQVVESKPENQIDDLRISRPWPQLEEYARSFDLNAVDDTTRHHLPYAVVLLLAAARWKEGHGGQLPRTSKERSEFKEVINDLRSAKEDVPMEAENFDEALRAAFHVWTSPSVPVDVQRLLHDPETHLHPQSSDFWVVVTALRMFVENEGDGCLPLEGTIPDMHASTELYLQLQQVYRDQAERDVAIVQGYVSGLLSKLGRAPGSIAPSMVKLMCRNGRNLRALRYPTLNDEYASGSSASRAIASALTSEHTNGDAALYVLLRAVDRFYESHGRYPGVFDSELDEDVAVLKGLAGQMLSEWGVNGASIPDDYVAEMCRFGSSELHVVATVVGGMAAQEAIKIITKQFVPFSGSLIYNAMSTSTAIFEG